MTEEIIVIGYIRSDYRVLEECPANGWKSDKITYIVLDNEYVDGLDGLAVDDYIHVLWWCDKAPRNVLKNYVQGDCKETGVFAMRSPHRPNPIALSLCKIKKIQENVIGVQGLEALNETPVIDIKKAISFNNIIL